MNNQAWRECISEAYGDRGIRLPRDLIFGGEKDHAKLFLSRAALAKNMQHDAAAFEGWALVLMRWCRVQKVSIDWETAASNNIGHFERFLYRIERFTTLTGGKIAALDQEKLHAAVKESKFFKSKQAKTLTLNIDPVTRVKIEPSNKKLEAGLEWNIVNTKAGDKLRKDCSLDCLFQQFPVGLYDGKPEREKAIFTGGRSAIDLIGIDASDDVWFFELKKGGNAKVGSLSELFFYSAMLKDIGSGLFSFAEGGGDLSRKLRGRIKNTKKIHARILAPNMHPLIDIGITNLLNQAARSAGWPVDFDLIELHA